MVIGYTAGVFDMFHIGHLNLIRSAKKQCDHLIVGISTDELVEYDNSETPVIPYEERAAIVSALRYVNEAVPQYDKDLIGVWDKYHFNKLFVEGNLKENDEYSRCMEKLRSKGVDVIYLFPVGEI